jgi:hypothetical protein
MRLHYVCGTHKHVGPLSNLSANEAEYSRVGFAVFRFSKSSAVYIAYIQSHAFVFWLFEKIVTHSLRPFQLNLMEHD